MGLQDLLPRTFDVLQEGIGRGFHFGGQLAICRNAELVLDEAFGTLGPDSSEPMRTDHVLCWRSAGKPWTAVLLLQLVEQGLVDLDTTVDRWLPPEWYQSAYGELNSDAALIADPPSLRQILTHTTGWEPVDTGWPELSTEKSLDRVFHAKLRSGASAGHVAAYDPSASWFAFGQVIEQTLGKDDPDSRGIADLVAAAVFAPAGVDVFLADTQPEPEIRHDFAPQFDTTRGRKELLPLTTPSAISQPSPGSSCRGPISSLATLYATLLADLGGDADNKTLLEPETMKLMTTRHRSDMVDLTFQHKLDFGLGVIVDSNRYGVETVPYGFGRYASEAAFGHGGAQCAMGFADPEHDLAVAWVLNGLAGEPRHNKRNREINSAIYEDLGLV